MDENSLIFGLESASRELCPVVGDPDIVRFFGKNISCTAFYQTVKLSHRIQPVATQSHFSHLMKTIIKLVAFSF